MKTKQYLFGTMLFCASAAFISCSSSEEDNIISPVQPDEGLTTITVGSPTIVQDGADTRMTFTYDSGLKMEWEADDAIQIAGYNSANSYRRSFTADYKAVSSGSSSTFEKISGSPTTTGHYNIGYLKGKTFTTQTGYSRDNSSFGGSAENGYTTWQSSLTFATTQTQAGNNNTAHLKNNYVCILQNVNAYDSPTFSNSWAESHDGNFYQSSCLKFDFQLPMDANLTAVKKMVVEAKNSSDENANIFYNTSDHSDSPTNTITLNFTGLDTFNGNVKSQNLVGYFMLPAADWTIPANTTFNVKVFYGTGASDYIAKALTITSEKTLAAGTLGVFKSAKTTGWTGTSTSKLWSFNTLDVKYYWNSSANSANQVESSGLYFIGGTDQANSVRVTTGSGTKTFSNDAGGNSVTISQYAIIYQNSNMEDLSTALSTYHSATDTGDNFCGQITLDVEQAGKLYVIAKAVSGGTMKVVFQANDGTYGAETTSTSTSDTELSCTATGAGTFRLYSATKGMNVYAIKFVPSN